MTPPRRRLSADERRTQLAEAAVEVIAAQGYSGATADAIAAQAGVSKGLLWHYFDDRDALLEHVARETFAQLRRAVGADIDLGSRADATLRAAIHRAAELPMTHPQHIRAVREIATNLRSADGSPRLGPQEYAETHRLQAEIVQRGVDEGVFRGDADPLTTAMLYQGLVDTMIEHLLEVPNADAAALADQVADLLLGGIRK